MSSVPNQRCPYCVRDLDDPAVVETIEHVFVEGLGGRATVRACVDCNSRIGSEIEGRLLASGTLLAFQREMANGTGPKLRVTLPTGDVYDVNLATGEQRAARPVEEQVRDEATTRRISGPDEQVRAIVEGMAKKHPSIDAEETIAKAIAHRVDEVSSELVVDTGLESRLAAKVALAAGTRCLGDDFVTSQLAHELRAILNGEKEALVEPADKLRPALDAAGIHAVDSDRQCVWIEVPPEGPLGHRSVIRIRMFGREIPIGSALVVYAPSPQPLMLLHEADTGEIECLDDYVRNRAPN
jgi:hypothetical protein